MCQRLNAVWYKRAREPGGARSILCVAGANAGPRSLPKATVGSILAFYHNPTERAEKHAQRTVLVWQTGLLPMQYMQPNEI
jgi:hypothetical protein